VRRFNKPLVHYSTPSDTKERDYLLAWFKYKGFDTWTSFKALILHYYLILLRMMFWFYSETAMRLTLEVLVM
jgi:hypothetical protein